MPKMRETQPRPKLGGDVLQYLEYEKLCKPSITISELQQVHPVELPSKVSDFKMYKGRPCHDKQTDLTGLTFS